MAPNLPQPVTSAIETALLCTGKPNLPAIAAVFNTTYQTVCQIRRRLRNRSKPRKRSGRKPKLDQDRIGHLLRELLASRPELDQGEIVEILVAEEGVRVSQSTVSRLLKRLEIPHKRFKTGGEPRPKERVEKGPPEDGAEACQASKEPDQVEARTLVTVPYNSPYS